MHRTRVRVRWGRIGSLLAAAGLAVSIAGGAARATGSPEPETRPASVRAYTVRPGDTVWAIARRLAGPEADPRPVVDRILARNGIEASGLRVGQVLTLPGR